MPDATPPPASLMCECSHQWAVHAESGQTANSATCHGYAGSATPGPLREPCRCTGFRGWAGPIDSRTGQPVKPLTVSTAPAAPRPLTGCIATCPPGCTERHALTAPDVVAGLLADVADARAQLADVQHGAGAWIREAVARETAGLTARLAEVTADRDHLAAKLAETLAANQRWAETFADAQQRYAEVKRERDAYKLRAHHYEGMGRKERGLPPDDYEPGSVVIGPGERVIVDMPVADAAELAIARRDRDAHKLRADHYEGLWRAEHGLPPETMAANQRWAETRGGT